MGGGKAMQGRLLFLRSWSLRRRIRQVRKRKRSLGWSSQNARAVEVSLRCVVLISLSFHSFLQTQFSPHCLFFFYGFGFCATCNAKVGISQ